MRNAFEITIRQTINLLPSQVRYYRFQQLELRFVLQMKWYITHHIRAQYVEHLFNALLCSSFEDNELFFLSFCVPAKPSIAKDLIEADDIDRKDVADFIDSLLDENLSFTTP